MQTIGLCNGTFGELIQGTIDKENFLVTMPIDRYSWCSYDVNKDNDGLNITEGKWKALKAAELFLNYYSLPLNGTIKIKSELFPGKGMASSSADIVATLRAIIKFYHLNTSEDIIGKIAACVEPTDGVMYNQVVAFNHYKGSVIRKISCKCKFEILGIIPSGSIDTVGYQSNRINYRLYEMKQFEKAYKALIYGLESGDTSLVGKAATISACINQNYLPKPSFKDLLYLVEEVKAEGVIVAHSGTVVGVMLCLKNPCYWTIRNLLIDGIKEIYSIEPVTYCNHVNA